MAVRSGFQEEKLPDKLHLGIWFRFLKMTRKDWRYLFLGVFASVFVSFIDASFLPLFFAGAIDTASKIPSMGTRRRC